MDVSVVVYVDDAAAAQVTLQSFEAPPDGDLVTITDVVVVDATGALDARTGDAWQAECTVVDARGAGKWAAVSRGVEAARHQNPLTLFAGEVVDTALAGLVEQERAETRRRERSQEVADVPEDLRHLGLDLRQGGRIHPRTVFEGHSTFFAYVDNSRESFFGAFSYSLSMIPITIRSVGRYTSIAADVVFGAAEHPLDALSTSPFAYHVDHPPFGGYWPRTGHQPPAAFTRTEEQQYRDVTIGHDVWIGARASVKGGVSLGDGCVIGTGAVVTKDIPPYAVVAGVPARVLRYRFDSVLVNELLRARWWRFSPDVLMACDLSDPRAALAKLAELEASRRALPWLGCREPLLDVVPGMRPS